MVVTGGIRTRLARITLTAITATCLLLCRVSCLELNQLVSVSDRIRNNLWRHQQRLVASMIGSKTKAILVHTYSAYRGRNCFQDDVRKAGLLSGATSVLFGELERINVFVEGRAD